MDGPVHPPALAAVLQTLAALARDARSAGSDREVFDGDRLDRRDPALIAAVLPALHALNQRYLRLSVEGLENLGALADEPVLYVGNHNGGIMGPDLSCTLATLWQHRGVQAPLHPLAHDFEMRQLAPLGRLLQRLGAVRASPDNARRVLMSGASALVYPGGDLEAYRHFRRRNQIVLGRRSGFVRLLQQTGAPVVPIVAHGAHRSAVIFTEGEAIARALRLQRWGRLSRFPLALALPWGVAIGPWLPYLPLPFPVRLRVLPPERIARSEDPDAARDRIAARMQAALDELAAAGRRRV
jgi:1-acyl-sn-glycerol-3-phosphate acyltransferase